MESNFRLFYFKDNKCCRSDFKIALIEATSFCDEARRAKDTAESRFPAPKKLAKISPKAHHPKRKYFVNLPYF